ncbi:hypothetical protein EK21DRAFT_119655 [Setomelanomma holmii]|uniref:N-acetyltransferase domain-containing protein n=1 Tax=Setomelanomma holmii TaxID=210430 RepID=A0A9P4LEW1_9PLEO|nr:hypothetical protein EK21DRAFT_119655 [Setomelanomma holmii]
MDPGATYTIETRKDVLTRTVLIQYADRMWETLGPIFHEQGSWHNQLKYRSDTFFLIEYVTPSGDRPGFLLYEQTKSYTWIWLLHVNKSYRRQGVAASLFQHVQIQNLALATGASTSNKLAKRFYEKQKPDHYGIRKEEWHSSTLYGWNVDLKNFDCDKVYSSGGSHKKWGKEMFLFWRCQL